MKKTETKTKLDRDEGTFKIDISLRIWKESVKNDFLFGFEKDFLTTMNVMLDNFINGDVTLEEKQDVRVMSEKTKFCSPYVINYHIPYIFDNYNMFKKVYLRIRKILKDLYSNNNIIGVIHINDENSINIEELIGRGVSII